MTLERHLEKVTSQAAHWFTLKSSLAVLPGQTYLNRQQNFQNNRKRSERLPTSKLLIIPQYGLSTKVRLVKAMIFPVVTYDCESWAIKKAEH